MANTKQVMGYSVAGVIFVIVLLIILFASISKKKKAGSACRYRPPQSPHILPVPYPIPPAGVACTRTVAPNRGVSDEYKFYLDDVPVDSVRVTTRDGENGMPHLVYMYVNQTNGLLVNESEFGAASAFNSVCVLGADAKYHRLSFDGRDLIVDDTAGPHSYKLDNGQVLTIGPKLLR